MSYKIKSRIWIEHNGDILLGEGRVALLKAIDQMGSLSKAAKSMGMSYKKAWNLVDAVNSRAARPVCQRVVGGKAGGGTEITPYGKQLIETFENLNKNCWNYLDQEIKKTPLQ